MKETVCCFFGHRNITDEITDDLRKAVRSAITDYNARMFYVGNHGSFDVLAFKVLREMKDEFPYINYAVVLAYMPGHSEKEYSYYSPEETLYPDGLEKVPRKFAIVWRNNWMLKQSDTVICYVYHHFGGAGQMIEKAQKQNKTIINLHKN